MNQLDQKITDRFAGVVVRKDLVKQVKGNAIVPSYVLEYLLGQYCATADEESIRSGIETVKEILRRHYVHRNEAKLIQSKIRENRRHKVIDKISVSLNEKRDEYEATFSNLGIRVQQVPADVVRRHEKLLVSGVWCIADVEYYYEEESRNTPWVLDTLKPIQLSHFDFDGYLDARRQFSTDEWIDLLMQSIGFDPEYFGRRSKLHQLVRLIPFCERNYNLIELGPKGTGKSHIYSEFSPHGILVSGGEVTVAKLFVNNATGRMGLVGYWDTVAFDEFAGKSKRANKTLVDILKNYMANKTFSRGVETLGAEASMVFVGNTQHTLPYMLRHSDLFAELPDQYHDSAFLDRLHFYLPGWEVDIIRGEMFSVGYGFVVDYLAEILRNMRSHDFSGLYRPFFELSSDISTRDRTGVLKTFSGLMKILYPHREATRAEIEEVLQLALEGRKRVKDQLLRLDATYAAVDFGYRSAESGVQTAVETLEEANYPQLYHSRNKNRSAAAPETDGGPPPTNGEAAAGSAVVEEKPAPGHRTIKENQRGIAFAGLFGPYLRDATEITITDPYIRTFYQALNLMELLAVIAEQKPVEAAVAVRLVTVADEMLADNQLDYLRQMQASCSRAEIDFTWTFAAPESVHDRHIITDTGWKILLGRGLDIFQKMDRKDALDLASHLQSYRLCKPCTVTYVRMADAD